MPSAPWDAGNCLPAAVVFRVSPSFVASGSINIDWFKECLHLHNYYNQYNYKFQRVSLRHKESTQNEIKLQINILRIFREQLELKNIGFFWRGESPVPGEKPSEKGEDQQQTESTQRQTRIEPRPHRWKGNALTITPFLFP